MPEESHGLQRGAAEVIVVDDGSGDGSAGVAREYGARLLRFPDSRGPAVARNAGAGVSRRFLIRAVYLPACLPQIFTGLRLALANALVIAVSCELVSPSIGLGSMIWLAWQTFATERLYLAILLTAVLGGLLHQALRTLEKRVVPWKVQNGV